MTAASLNCKKYGKKSQLAEGGFKFGDEGGVDGD